MESSSTWMSKIFTQINWKRLSLIGVPFMVLAVLVTGGIFTTSVSAAPRMDETIMGPITHIDGRGTLLTVQNAHGRGQTIVHVNRNTKFVSRGMGPRNAFRDLKVGDFIQAIGPRNHDHDRTIEAKQIIVSRRPSDWH